MILTRIIAVILLVTGISMFVNVFARGGFGIDCTIDEDNTPTTPTASVPEPQYYQVVTHPQKGDGYTAILLPLLLIICAAIILIVGETYA